MQIPGYRIIRKINQGGMSTVYLAIQLSVGREVALKVMSPALNADPVFSERFQREANIVGQLSHPNIVSIYDIGRYKNLNYIAMDYLPGGSVHDKMASGISTPEVLRITKEVATALDHAHEKGYIHRDIKPENILFREDNSSVLTDFGVAKTVTTASKMTNAGTVVGTPHYMSPEQARGKPIDGRADIYSLGIVFYEMLTGSVPFTADEAVAIAIKHLTAPTPKLPPQHAVFQKILDRLLAKDANDRYQRGKDLTDAIEEVEKNLLVGSPRYLSTTDTTGVQIMPLFKALLLTTYAALALKVKELFSFILSWRWTPKRGFYRNPGTLTEIRTEVDTAEDDKSTIVSTHIQKAAYVQPATHRTGYFFRSLIALAVTSVLWTTMSLAIAHFDMPGEEHIPAPLHSAGIYTADFINKQSEQLIGTLSPSTEPDVELTPDNHKTAAADSLSSTPDTRDSTRNASVVTTTAAQNSESVSLSTRSGITEINPHQTGIVKTSLTETTATEQEEPPRYALTVLPTPEKARIRILNIREKYHPGIELAPGRYHIEVTRRRYDKWLKWITVKDNPVIEKVTLKKTPVPGAVFHNDLPGGIKGPDMVVIPAGSYTMGDKNESTTTPTRKIQFKYPFAISKYEITFADFQHFATATNTPVPSDKGWGKGSRPVINISWDQAQNYVDWLKESTGQNYRLPTEAEWEYIARAGTTSLYWWPENQAKNKANCRRGCNSKYSGLFSARTAPVGTYQPNAFGVYDTAGNVAEWVADCYQNHYLGAPSDGSAVYTDNCSSRVVRGGSMRSTSKQLYNYLRTEMKESSIQENIGIRVVVDLY